MSGERRTSFTKEIPWVVHNGKKPKAVEGFMWVPIKENDLKPQQRQGWKRVPVVVKEFSTNLNVALVSTKKKPQSAQRPSDISHWKPDAPLVEGEN